MSSRTYKPKQSRNAINSFLTSKHEISVKVGKTLIEPSLVENYINDFNHLIVPDSKTISKVVKMIYKGKNGDDVKMKMIGTNNSYVFNESTRVYRINDSCVMLEKKITPLDDTTMQVASRTELSIQYTMPLLSNTDWNLRVNIVKRIDNPLELETRLKPCKVALMDTPFTTMATDSFDYIETELIRLTQNPIEYADLLEMINSITNKSGEDNDEQYQNAIFELAKDIYKDAITVAKFKRESGFKRLSPSPIELNRILFFKNMLPKIDSFYMTDKMDGLRAILVIDEIYKMNGKKKSYIGATIYAVSDKIYEINSCEHKSSRATVVEHTVLDVEMMVEKDKSLSFHCFDIIMMKSRRIGNLPFFKRIEFFKEANALLDKHDIGSVKEFIKLSNDDFCKQITEFYNKKRDYKIDGLIFTPAGGFFKDLVKERKNRFDRIFNTKYSDTISFKWKPLDHLTIDFYIMEYPKKKGYYALCSGVDFQTFKRLKMEFFDGYKAPESPNAHQYFPIQFETYDNEFNYIWKPSDKELELFKASNETIGETKFNTMNGMVGEFQLASKDSVLPEPRLIRLRTDRIADIAKGEYYGNAIRYSELIWHSIRYPLSIDTMCNPTNNAYFAADDVDGWYKAGRSFNSFAKSYLIDMYLPPNKESVLMDVAAGKGQDLARSIDAGYSTIIAMDKDTDAISEILERKYNLRVKSKQSSAAVHIKKIDLEDSADDTIKKLHIKSEFVDNMMINFALHYICHSAIAGDLEPIVEFAKLCKFYLKKHGRVMITTFNGEDVFDKLKSTDSWDVVENNRLKYSIKKKYTSDEMTNLDQVIDVLLPFSAGEYYQEYLANYKYIQGVFESHGFSLMKTDSFESLLRDYKKQNMRGYKDLTNGDKEYVSLYGYMIFEKKD